MKRVVCMILIAGLTVMGLAGCGGKTQQTESAGAESLKATENSVAETKEVQRQQIPIRERVRTARIKCRHPRRIF